MASSQGQSNYNQKEKIECRRRLIEQAVKSLTTERKTSTCVYRDHVRKAWEEFHGSGASSSFNERQIKDIEDEIKNWEDLHDSNFQVKKPSDLHVCYLAGDNPLNDFNVFVENGVLPQNMWAIEKDANVLKKALENSNQAQKMPKVLKGNLLDLLSDFKPKFDIIYFDACGTLPSEKQETLKVIGSVFLYNKLTSPGALITTFSFPPKQTEGAAHDPEREHLRELSIEYLKHRLVNTSVAHKIPHQNEELLKAITDEEIYSEYIFYQIIDTAYMYIPVQRMLNTKRNSLLLEQSFVKKRDLLKAIEELLPTVMDKDLESAKDALLIDLREKSKSILKLLEDLDILNEKLQDKQRVIRLVENKKQALYHLLIKAFEMREAGPEEILQQADREVTSMLIQLQKEQIEMLEQEAQLNQLMEKKTSTSEQIDELNQVKHEIVQDLSVHEAQPPRYLGKLGDRIQSSSNPLCKAWFQEVFPDWKPKDFKNQSILLLLMIHLLTNWIALINKCSNKYFKNFLVPITQSLNGGEDSTFSQFVDVPNEDVTTRMIATLLYGQMAHPSFPVLDKLLRLRYTARTRQMFSNLFIFDDCRYVYDHFPTVQTSTNVTSPHKQMVFRMAVDGLRKHLTNICEEDVFKCCRVVPMQGRVREIPESEKISFRDDDDDLHDRDVDELHDRDVDELHDRDDDVLHDRDVDELHESDN